MINIVERKEYWLVEVYQDDNKKAKAYVWKKGLISNLYIRKPYRGDNSVLKELYVGISMFNHLGLYGYASPKQGLEKRDALKRLYRRYGFENKKGNKITKI